MLCIDDMDDEEIDEKKCVFMRAMPSEISLTFDFCNIDGMWDARMRFESRHCRMHKWMDWWHCWPNRATSEMTWASRWPIAVQEMEWTNNRWRMAANRQWSRRQPCWVSGRLSFHVSSMIYGWAFVCHCSTNDVCPQLTHMIPLLMFDYAKNAHSAVICAIVVAADVGGVYMSHVYMTSSNCEWLTMIWINPPIRRESDVSRHAQMISENNYSEYSGWLWPVPPIDDVDFVNSHNRMSNCHSQCHRHWFSPMPVEEDVFVLVNLICVWNIEKCVYLGLGHAVVAWCEYTTNARVNVQHHCHRYEERAHRRKHHVSFVMIVSTFNFTRRTVMTTRLVPTTPTLKWRRKKNH